METCGEYRSVPAWTPSKELPPWNAYKPQNSYSEEKAAVYLQDEQF